MSENYQKIGYQEKSEYQKKTLKHNFLTNQPYQQSSSPKKHKFQLIDVHNTQTTDGTTFFQQQSELHQKKAERWRKNTSTNSTVSDRVSIQIGEGKASTGAAFTAFASLPFSTRSIIPVEGYSVPTTTSPFIPKRNYPINHEQQSLRPHSISSLQLQSPLMQKQTGGPQLEISQTQLLSKFYSTRPENTFKPKSEIQEFKEQLDGKMQRIQHFIEKAEQAQTERQRSGGRHRLRRTTMSPEKTSAVQDYESGARQCRKFDGIVSSDLMKKLQSEKKILSQQSSYASINFQPDIQEIVTSRTKEMGPQKSQFSQVSTLKVDRIDTIIEDEMSKSDNEEETKIVQLLTKRRNPNSQCSKVNDRYSKHAVKNLSLVDREQMAYSSHSFKQQINSQNPEHQIINNQKQSNVKNNKTDQRKVFLSLSDQRQYQEDIYDNLQCNDEYYARLQALEQRVEELNNINKVIIEENKKLSQKSKHYHKKYSHLKQKVKMQDSQTAQQSELFQVQNQRIDLINNERIKLINSHQVQENQIRNLKYLLNQSLATKIKYENIFKKLLEDDNCRNYVLDLLKL